MKKNTSTFLKLRKNVSIIIIYHFKLRKNVSQQYKRFFGFKKYTPN